MLLWVKKVHKHSVSRWHPDRGGILNYHSQYPTSNKTPLLLSGNILGLVVALLQRAFTRYQYLHNVCQVLLPTSKEAVVSLTSLLQLLPRSIIFNTDSCVTNNAIESHHLQGFLKIGFNPTFLNEKTEVQRCQGHRTQSDDDTHLFGIIFQHGLSFSLPVCVKA